MLSPQTSPIGGIGHPSARIVLVGSQGPQTSPNFAKDPDPLIFSEIVEFALSLTPPPRGQDPYQGIPHLQAYRFVRAMALAEIGDIQLATRFAYLYDYYTVLLTRVDHRYCDAITATVGRSSPYFTTSLLDHLKGLSDRITGVVNVDKSGSWMGAKLSKPSLDTIGGWLEGRFTKLVTGDVDTPMVANDEAKAEDRSFSGPFSHYGAISSTTSSARSSPQPSMVNIMPPRSGSAMASSPAYHPQIDRASSAMDYVKRKPSPAPRIASANPATSTFSYSPLVGQPLDSHGAPNGHQSSDMITPRPPINAQEGGGNADPEGAWWGSSTYDGNSTAKTPTASTFLRVDENILPSQSDGFISLMDSDPYSVTTYSPTKPVSKGSPTVGDDEDLGFGNAKRSKSKDSNNKPDREESSHTPGAAQTPQPEATGQSKLSK